MDGEKKELEINFPKEYTRRAIIYAISNSQDIDALSKFNKFGEKTKYSMSLCRDGKCSYVDESTCNVDELVLQPDNMKYVTNYKIVKADVQKKGIEYKVLNCKHMWQSNPSNKSATEAIYGFEYMKDETVYPMINVPEKMLGKVSNKEEITGTSIIESTSARNTKTKKNRRSVFDDPDVKMTRFIESMCAQQYKYGYKISSLNVDEISDRVLDGKCVLKIKNSNGVWGRYTLHCMADFKREKLIILDVDLFIMKIIILKYKYIKNKF